MNSTQVQKTAELLKQLRTLSVPRCQNAADEFAYMACRDEIIDDVLECIGHSTPQSDPVHFVSVDEQALAQIVLTRTFDSHKDVLRQQIKAAQLEAEKWRQIAMAADPQATRKFALGSSPSRTSLTADLTLARPAVANACTQTSSIVSQPQEAMSVPCQCFITALQQSLMINDELLKSFEEKSSMVFESVNTFFHLQGTSSQQEAALSRTVSEAAKGVTCGSKAPNVHGSKSNRKSDKKRVVASQQWFDRLAAARSEPVLQPPAEATPPQNEHVLYAIRAMPIEKAYARKSTSSSLPALTKK